MDKPHSFAGRVIKKYGKTITNDYEQPDKFFADMHDCFRLLDGIPFSAVEDLEKYEINRDVMVEIVRRIIKIFAAAKVDIIQEIDRIDEDPFDGLEEDIAVKKSSTPQIRISGETEET